MKVKAMPDFFAQVFTAEKMILFAEFVQDIVDGKPFTKIPP